MTFTFQQSMEIGHCYKCGVAYALPADYDKQRRRDGREFWCPNGHGQSYVTDAELKKEQAGEKAIAENVELRQRVLKLTHELDQQQAASAVAAEAHGADAAAAPPARTPDRIGEFTCADCGKVYRQRGSFERHVRGHEIEAESAQRGGTT